MVLSYAVKGAVVEYRSAERNGQQEELPLSLVDMEATKAWQRAHDPSEARSDGTQAVPVLSPELAREEAALAAQTPEVAKDLRLPEGNSVVVLDTYRGTPELVPLPQSGSDLNRETAHAVQKRDLNPAASPHDLELLKEERSDIQLHVAEPVFFVRVAEPAAEGAGGAFVVDTGGQGQSQRSGQPSQSRYVLEHLDVRQGARAVSSLRLAALGSGRSQADVVELQPQLLPGGVWLKLSLAVPLEFGEYALVEVLGDRAVNGDVWDFGVHPTARENDEALRPEPRRPVRLEHRAGQP